MQHADDFNGLIGNTVKGQILPDDEMPDAGRDIVTSNARTGIYRDLPPAPFNCVEHPVGR